MLIVQTPYDVCPANSDSVGSDQSLCLDILEDKQGYGFLQAEAKTLIGLRNAQAYLNLCLSNMPYCSIIQTHQTYNYIPQYNWPRAI